MKQATALNVQIKSHHESVRHKSSLPSLCRSSDGITRYLLAASKVCKMKKSNVIACNLWQSWIVDCHLLTRKGGHSLYLYVTCLTFWSSSGKHRIYFHTRSDWNRHTQNLPSHLGWLANRKTCQPSSSMEPAGTEAEGTTKDELVPDDRQGPPDGEQAMERCTEGGCWPSPLEHFDCLMRHTTWEQLRLRQLYISLWKSPSALI